MDLNFDFAGRRFLITGPSPHSTIGKVIAHKLAEAGASMTLVARGEAGLREIQASLPHPERHIVAPYDLNDLDGIPPWMKKLAETNGAFDGLVHCAALQNYSPIRTINAADFEATFRINVGASLLLARGFRQKGVYNKPGSFILVSSAAGLRGIKGRSLYAGSKATQVALTRTLSIELAADQIRVNCLAPGVVTGTAAEHMFNMMTPEQNASLLAAHPFGYANGTDVATAAAFLLSHEARVITGAVLTVDGGYSAL